MTALLIKAPSARSEFIFHSPRGFTLTKNNRLARIAPMIEEVRQTATAVLRPAFTLE